MKTQWRHEKFSARISDHSEASGVSRQSMKRFKDVELHMYHYRGGDWFTRNVSTGVRVSFDIALNCVCCRKKRQGSIFIHSCSA